MSRTIHALAVILVILSGCGNSGSPKSDNPASTPPPSPPKIANFYTAPGIIENGQPAQLCYSVEGTTKLTLDPPVDRVWPALTRCLEIKPSKTTTYTLTAENSAGTKVTATTEAKVVAATAKAAAVKIDNVSAPPGTIQPGQGFQFCIHAANAKDWKLSSGQWFAPPESTGGCVIDHPTKTTVYIVTAIGAAGDTDTTRVTATVK
jgi:hypothetical protein